MNFIDILIIILLIFGFVVGFKKGAIKSSVELILLILVCIIASILKNPISIFLYKSLPLFNKLLVLNILFYEVIAFLICFSILMIAGKIILKFSGILDRIINATIILKLPSKIIGGFLGFIQTYIICFIILVFFSSSGYLKNSKISTTMIYKTPVVSNYTSDICNKQKLIFKTINEYKNSGEEKANYETLKVMVDNNFITKDNLKYLVEKKKVNIKNINDLIN